MSFIFNVFNETWKLFLEMSPYLFLGFVIAGILHIFVTSEKIAKHIGGSNFWSVLKASLFGIPLPLCSCGVIPASVALKKEGASKSSILSFLITTPTTGVDSILATFALLGPVFAVFRIIASFITGIVAGIIGNILKIDSYKKEESEVVEVKSCCSEESGKSDETIFDKITGVFKYGFVKLLSDINNSLILGLFLGGIIICIIPENFFVKYIGNSFVEMFVMLIAGIPIYICATGSIPLASALILKGMSPGAGFVFLLAGPATNAVTISVIGKELGKKALIIYISVISFFSIFFGIILNKLWTVFKIDVKTQIHMNHSSEMMYFIKIITASIIALFLLWSYIKKFKSSSNNKSLCCNNEKEPISSCCKEESSCCDDKLSYEIHIENMHCGGCASKIKKILADNFEITKVNVDLDKKNISFMSKIDTNEIIKKLKENDYNGVLI